MCRCKPRPSRRKRITNQKQIFFHPETPAFSQGTHHGTSLPAGNTDHKPYPARAARIFANPAGKRWFIRATTAKELVA